MIGPAPAEICAALLGRWRLWPNMLRGRVIGMNTAGLSPSGGSTGIGFAVPVNLIAKVVPDLIAQGYYNHPGWVFRSAVRSHHW